jgi:dihydrofolate synthase/folylpolyglutamate synthase
MILKSDLSHLVAGLRPRIEAFHRDRPECGNLTYFEVLSALAFLYFRDKGAEWVVLETGLGGRLDATNAADAWVTVITPVSYDHQHLLGTTLPEIAFEKAGIIKRSNHKDDRGRGVCVTAPQVRDVREVLRRRCRGEGVVLFEMEKDFSCRGLRADLLAQEFFYQGLHDRSYFLKTRMLGPHQLANASAAVAACEALSLFKVHIPMEAIREGVAEAFWPGRLEVVRTRPFVLLDGAHNGDSALRLARFLEREFKDLRKWLVFGVSEDKNIKDIARQLEPVVDSVILTRSASPRAADPEKALKPYFKKSPVVTTRSVEEALDVLQREIKGEEVAVVTGSLFVVAEARALWQK